MLLIRMEARPNPMGGFLVTIPVGVLPAHLDPIATRQLSIEGALSRIEARIDPDAAWEQLVAYGSGGIDAAQYEKLKAVMINTDFTPMAERLGYHFWRALIGTIASIDEVAARAMLMAIVTDCAAKGDVHSWTPRRTGRLRYDDAFGACRERRMPPFEASIG